MRQTIFLSLGSNIGDRARNLINALSFLQSNGVSIKKISSLYETSPIGPKQRNFYNLCLSARCRVSPIEFLNLIKNIETTLGRKKTKYWGARIIDIDILFFGKLSLQKKNLIIPHREIKKRLFVLLPLNEIAPNFKHPSFNETIQNILENAKPLIKEQKIKNKGSLL